MMVLEYTEVAFGLEPQPIGVDALAMLSTTKSDEDAAVSATGPGRGTTPQAAETEGGGGGPRGPWSSLRNVSKSS
jgi:hypothetical protein